MTIAHEYGHLVLHRGVFASIRSEDDLKALFEFFAENPGVYTRFENQAFMFAGCLLIPEETLVPVTRAVIEEMQAKSGKALDLRSEYVWKLIKDRVALRYEVNPPVAKRVLQTAGLWMSDSVLRAT